MSGEGGLNPHTKRGFWNLFGSSLFHRGEGGGEGEEGGEVGETRLVLEQEKIHPFESADVTTALHFAGWSWLWWCVCLWGS